MNLQSLNADRIFSKIDKFILKGVKYFFPPCGSKKASVFFAFILNVTDNAFKKISTPPFQLSQDVKDKFKSFDSIYHDQTVQNGKSNTGFTHSGIWQGIPAKSIEFTFSI